jgi:glycosyltransferase involved in cell wall biosynthesis
MKVLLLSNLFPSKHEPTRGMFNKQVFGALADFCEVRVVCPGPWWTRARRPGDLVRVPRDSSSGLNVTYPVYWSLPRIGTRFHGEGMYHSLRGHVHKLYKEFRFDVILAAWAYPDAYAAARLAQDFHCPLVTKLMGSDINDLASRPDLLSKIRWTLERSARVVAVSGALQEKVLELGIPSERVVVQHNGVDGNLFQIRSRSEARARLDLPQDRKLIVYIGNLRLVKGTDVLIEAMGILAGKLPDADLLLVGGGELEESLRSRVQALGLDNRVRFCGRQGHATVPDWMCASDVFCLPSRNEGCPNVVLEALASGRPVVASNVGGIPEILKEGSGILVEPENPEALTKGMEEALRHNWDPQLLRNNVEFLSWKEVAWEYHRFLCDSIENK